MSRGYFVVIDADYCWIYRNGALVATGTSLATALLLVRAIRRAGAFRRTEEKVDFGACLLAAPGQ